MIVIVNICPRGGGGGGGVRVCLNVSVQGLVQDFEFWAGGNSKVWC